MCGSRILYLDYRIGDTNSGREGKDLDSDSLRRIEELERGGIEDSRPLTGLDSLSDKYCIFYILVTVKRLRREEPRLRTPKPF